MQRGRPQIMPDSHNTLWRPSGAIKTGFGRIFKVFATEIVTLGTSVARLSIVFSQLREILGLSASVACISAHRYFSWCFGSRVADSTAVFWSSSGTFSIAAAASYADVGLLEGGDHLYCSAKDGAGDAWDISSSTRPEPCAPRRRVFHQDSFHTWLLGWTSNRTWHHLRKCLQWRSETRCHPRLLENHGKANPSPRGCEMRRSRQWQWGIALSVIRKHLRKC